MAKKKKPQTKAIRNRRASFDYELGDSLLAGISLTGAETKSLRLGHGHLRGAYITVKDDEVWLLNATISGFTGAPIDDPTRTRKLLLKKREIAALITQKQQGKSIVPLELLTQGRYVKLRLSTGRGKKHYDKRETIKRRDVERAAKQQLQ